MKMHIQVSRPYLLRGVAIITRTARLLESATEVAAPDCGGFQSSIRLVLSLESGAIASDQAHCGRKCVKCGDAKSIRTWMCAPLLLLWQGSPLLTEPISCLSVATVPCSDLISVWFLTFSA